MFTVGTPPNCSSFQFQFLLELQIFESRSIKQTSSTLGFRKENRFSPNEYTNRGKKENVKSMFGGEIEVEGDAEGKSI